jgi:hypothetical protein
MVFFLENMAIGPEMMKAGNIRILPYCSQPLKRLAWRLHPVATFARHPVTSTFSANSGHINCQFRVNAYNWGASNMDGT